MISKVNHPNVVRIDSVYEDKVNLCIVMEYLEGGEVSTKPRDNFSS